MSEGAPGRPERDALVGAYRDKMMDELQSISAVIKGMKILLEQLDKRMNEIASKLPKEWP
jgi:hypothetical protein